MISKRKILVFTAGRSDFGILKKLISIINFKKSYDLTLVIGPAHNSKIFGYTNKEISEIKIKNKIYLKSLKKNSSKTGILTSISRMMKDTSVYLSKKKYDMAIVLGDRYEVLNFTFCCFNLGIPVAHIGGGSVTLGSLDDTYRRCISQMSTIHFVETLIHKKNLKKIGVKKNIFITGAPALEKILNKKNSISILNGEYDYFVKSKKFRIMACFHPETNISKKKNIKNLKRLISFLNSINQKVIFTYPNADEGYLDYINLIEKSLDKNCSTILKNLGIKRYHSLLSNCDLVIGNSSSGIIESCSFKIPCINVGDRQAQRLSPKNVIHCKFEISDIFKAYNKSLNKSFRKKIKKLKNPYEIKNSSLKIFKVINQKLKKNFI